jgi:hypothetical protein
LIDAPTSIPPPSFVKFLLKQGEVSLAEQIALCGLSKSNADGKDVSFILEEFLPISDDPDHLVEKSRENFWGRQPKGVVMTPWSTGCCRKEEKTKRFRLSCFILTIKQTFSLPFH